MKIENITLIKQLIVNDVKKHRMMSVNLLCNDITTRITYPRIVFESKDETSDQK